EVHAGDHLAGGGLGGRRIVGAVLGGTLLEELQPGRVAQKNEVARRIAERRINAEHGDLEYVSWLWIVRNPHEFAALVFLALDPLQPDPIPRIEARDRAAAALAERQVDGAVHPDLAVVIHRGLKPNRTACEFFTAHRLRDRHVDAIPAPAVLAGAARL